MIIHSDFPAEFWVDASCTTTCPINRLPSSILGGVSPFEKLFHHPPSYQFLKMFGCECFSLLMDSKINELQPKTKPCVFISYSMDYKGYPCLDPLNNKFFVSRHVLFHEHKFPYRTLVGSKSNLPYTSPMVVTFDWRLTNIVCVSPVVSHNTPSTPLVTSAPVQSHGSPTEAGSYPCSLVAFAWPNGCPTADGFSPVLPSGPNGTPTPKGFSPSPSVYIDSNVGLPATDGSAHPSLQHASSNAGPSELHSLPTSAPLHTLGLMSP